VRRRLQPAAWRRAAALIQVSRSRQVDPTSSSAAGNALRPLVELDAAMIARHAPWRCGGHYCCNFSHMRHPSPAVPQALPAQCSEMPESFSEIPERASSAGAAHGDWRAIAMNVVSASRAFERSAVYFVRKCNSRSASAGARVPTQEERCLSGNAAWPRRHRTMPRSRTPRTSPPPREGRDASLVDDYR